MKSKFTALLSMLALVFTLTVAPSFAGPSAGTSSYTDFSATNITGATWTPVVTSSVRGIRGVSIFNSATVPVEIGISYAGASANAEVTQMLAPPLLSSVGTPGAIYYPMSVGYGARISIRGQGSVGDVVSSGKFIMNFFY